MQFARVAGFNIIGTASTDEGLQLVRQQGAQHAINHCAPDYLRDIAHATGGRGVDVILEMLANVNLDNDLRMLAAGGRVVVIGSRGKIETTPRDLMQHEASVTGMMLWKTSEALLSEAYRAIQAGLENGSLCPVIGVEMPLAAAAEAHRKVMERGARGRVVLAI